MRGTQPVQVAESAVFWCIGRALRQLQFHLPSRPPAQPPVLGATLVPMPSPGSNGCCGHRPATASCQPFPLLCLDSGFWTTMPDGCKRPCWKRDRATHRGNIRLCAIGCDAGDDATSVDESTCGIVLQPPFGSLPRPLCSLGR